MLNSNKIKYYCMTFNELIIWQFPRPVVRLTAQGTSLRHGYKKVFLSCLYAAHSYHDTKSFIRIFST